MLGPVELQIINDSLPKVTANLKRNLSAPEVDLTYAEKGSVEKLESLSKQLQDFSGQIAQMNENLKKRIKTHSLEIISRR